MPLLATTAKGIGNLSSFAGRQASASGGSSLNASVGAQHLASSATQTSMRSLHIPAPGRAAHHPTPYSPRPGFSSSPATYAARALHGARQALTGFLEHLTTPGLSHAGPSRSLHTAFNATRPQSIQSRSSLPVRNAINRTFYARGIPTTGPKSVYDIGLGTARNFHSSRQVFQRIADNVPVYGRTLNEADFDLKKRKAAAKVDLRSLREKGKGRARSGEKSKAKENLHWAASLASETSSEDLFAAPEADSAVTTYLRIPLAPTPTSRVPLPSTESATSPQGIFSISELSALHHSYSVHSLRVSSIFMRLDAAKVWDTGHVKVDAFGDPLGLCTILQVEFKGWSAERVRCIVGEAGQSWCEIDEVLQPDRVGPTVPEIVVDPSDSLVLPKLDFSSSFLAGRETPARPTNISYPPSPTLSSCDELSSVISISPSLSDMEDNAELEEDDMSDHMVGLEPASTRGRLSSVSSSSGSWISFSSDFMQQTDATL